jgi:DNA repair protein RadA/Sms
VPRRQTVFTCGQCGRREAKWLGHCPDCGAWDSFVEEKVAAASGAGYAGRARRKSGDGGGAGGAATVRLSDVVSSAVDRFSSGIAELDLVLGGGIVPGSLVLVGGEPGIGKSTLLLQVLDHVAASGRSVLLVCGEESAAQVKMRAERICRDPGGISVLAETELETVLETVAAAAPALVVVDSVQTLYSDAFTSAPGSVSQVREAAGRFLRLAKDTGAAVFLVGHVTKEGAIAGPRVLEHMVDTVLQFEGDRYRFYRTLRAAKNRFGSTNELGIFEMTPDGLAGVADPSHLFLSDTGPAAGAAVHVAVEGSRWLRPQPPGDAGGRPRPSCPSAVVSGRHFCYNCRRNPHRRTCGRPRRRSRHRLGRAQCTTSAEGRSDRGDQPDGRTTFLQPE